MKNNNNEWKKALNPLLRCLSKISYSSAKFGAELASRAGQHQPKVPDKLRPYK